MEESNQIEYDESTEISINKEIDEIYKEIGEFGPYQTLILILISCSSFVLSNADYSYNIFLGATPDHRLILIFKKIIKKLYRLYIN